MIKIPVIDSADQQMGLVLNGRRVTLRLRYNTTSERWSFDLSIDDAVVLYAQRVVDGVDLLAPFNLGIGLLFVINFSDVLPVNRNAFNEEQAWLIHMVEAEYRSLKEANNG